MTAKSPKGWKDWLCLIHPLKAVHEFNFHRPLQALEKVESLTISWSTRPPPQPPVDPDRTKDSVIPYGLTDPTPEALPWIATSKNPPDEGFCASRTMLQTSVLIRIASLNLPVAASFVAPWSPHPTPLRSWFPQPQEGENGGAFLAGGSLRRQLQAPRTHMDDAQPEPRAFLPWQLEDVAVELIRGSRQIVGATPTVRVRLDPSNVQHHTVRSRIPLLQRCH